MFCRDDVEDRYPNRPHELEDASLMHFVQNFDAANATVIEKKRKHLLEFQKGVGYIKPRRISALINHPIPVKVKQTEEFYESFLLLFKPWRQRKAVLGSYPTYREAFEAESENNSAMVSYANKVCSLAEIRKDMEEKILEEEKKIEDDIAPEHIQLSAEL